MKHLVLLLSIFLTVGMTAAEAARYMYIYAYARENNSCGYESTVDYRTSVVEESQEIAEKKRLSDLLKAVHPSAAVYSSTSFFDYGPEATCVAVTQWEGGSSSCRTTVVAFSFGKTLTEAMDKANQKFKIWAVSGSPFDVLKHYNFLIPTITKQPKSQSAPKGQKVRFIMDCTGKNLRFQWRHDGESIAAANPSPSEISNSPTFSANSSTFEIEHVKPSDAGVYDCVITNEGGSIVSGRAKLSVTPAVPDISLEQPAGSNLMSGSATKSFGTVKVGNTGSAKTFTIRNKGYAKLTDLSIRTSGKHPDDFVVTKPLKTALAPGDATTFKVSFKPGAKTTRSASLRITSNDPDEEPFIINLTGAGAAK